MYLISCPGLLLSAAALYVYLSAARPRDAAEHVSWPARVTRLLLCAAPGLAAACVHYTAATQPGLSVLMQVLYCMYCVLYCTTRVCAGVSLGGAGGLGAGLAGRHPALAPAEVALPLPRAAGRIQPPLTLIRGKGIPDK